MRSRRLLNSLAVLALASGLSACASSTDTEASALTQSVSVLRAAFNASGSEETGSLRPTAGFPGIDPAILAGHSTPLLGVYIESREALAGLSPVEAGAGRIHWRTPDNIEVVTTGTGMLVATRGLGADLQAADARQTAALIASGRSGDAQRRHAYLDGNYAIQDVTLSCQVQRLGEDVIQVNNRSHRVIRFAETCTGLAEPIQNSYWRDAGATGLLRQSIQWVGPDIGRVHMQRLVD